MVLDSKPDRWGPSEWYGHDVFSMSDEERLAVAKDALLPVNKVNRPCPYMESIIDGSLCNKRGGICSTQRYSDDSGVITPQGIRVAICPSRLVMKTILKHISNTVLGTENSNLVKEVPYSLSMVKTLKDGSPRAAGRIDWLLVDAKNPENFCAVETQSVYMSGKSQSGDFDAIIKSQGKLIMPPNYRHPDYKSSVPKRLAPQLESKARHLTNAAKKTVVLVDKFVQENMSLLREVDVPPAFSQDPKQRQSRMLETCEVIFAVVTLANADAGRLVSPLYRYATIDNSRNALDAVAAMTKSEFFETVKKIVSAKKHKGKKIFPLS